jgi:glutamate--cysteine ligase
MYFVIRDGHYHDCTDVTFRQFLDGALANRIPQGRPNLGDWSNHLATLFPDVRLKRFLEMRGADGGPWRDICALPALWTGLFYDAQALSDAETLVEHWTHAMVAQLRDDVPVRALEAEIGGRTAREIASDMLALSRDGLARRNRRNSDGNDETAFLAPLEMTVASGVTPAELLLQRFHGPWAGDIHRLFDEEAF